MAESIIHSLLKNALHRLGYRLVRDRPMSRFQAMFESLTLLGNRGFAPRVVIDGGANVGNWSREAMRIFPAAQFHLVEPQATCWPSLERIAEQSARVTLHPFALTEAGVKAVCMIGLDDHGATGAHVVLPSESGSQMATVSCPAKTLDDLFNDVVPGDRTLLKLDLENHELTALRGADRLLTSVEVIVTELQFFDVNDSGSPVFADVVAFMQDRAFQLYDFASLSPRPRDYRLRQGDAIFVREDSPLLRDRAWE
jgi:FkbM family methyltransferase